MTLSLLLASTLLAAPVPSIPAGDECPNCGATLPAQNDLDARIERVVRRVLAESGATAPAARTAFGFSTVTPSTPSAPSPPKAHARGIFVTDDGEVHELDVDGGNTFFGRYAPPAPDAPHPPHTIRVQKGEAPMVVFRTEGDAAAPGGGAHAFHFGGDGDGEKVQHKIIIRSGGDSHELHADHDAPNVFRARKIDDAPHTIQWTTDGGKHEVKTEKKIEVRVDAGGKAPKITTRTIVVGPDGVMHDSEGGEHSIRHSIDALDVHGLHEQLQSGLHGIHVGLEGLEGLKGLEGLEGLHLEGLGGEIEVLLEMVGGDGDAPHVWHNDGGESFTFDVEVNDQGDTPNIFRFKSDTKDTQDAPAPNVQRRVLRRAADAESSVDATEAQIEALSAEIEALERRLERLLKQAGNN